MSAPLTGAAALRAAVPILRDAGIEDAARDARALLADAMGLSPDRLTLYLQHDLSEPAQARFQSHIAARQTRQPVAQILGRRAFWGLTFRVTPAVLDPRPETETLVKAALEQPFVRMLDLGTGSGAILLSCLKFMPVAQGIGIDISPEALEVATENAKTLGLSKRCRLVQSDWFEQVSGRFDLITSNPPYIAEDEMPGLAPEVLQHEPRIALTPGGDGLDAYRAIAKGAPARLLPGGRLMVEIGPTQGKAVMALFSKAGLAKPHILQDMDGRDRVVVATKVAQEDPLADGPAKA